MTIGIAASGPNAGEAILRGLASVEAVGRGAIGGFVSFAAIADGKILRAETQTGGSAALFAGLMPEKFRTARIAVLMSSGPNRPSPLSQFTPGDARIGLLTGHRFPNAAGADGTPLNEQVLSLMRGGMGPDEAVETVLAANADADAGIIALAADGRLHAGNTRYLSEFGDGGMVLVGDAESAFRIAVLHNAIRPFRGLATLAADVVRDAMEQPDRSNGFVHVDAGTAIGVGPRALHVDGAGKVVAITMPDRLLQNGRRSFGMGFEASIMRNAEPVGRAVYEPYMVAEGGRLVSIEGQTRLDIPVRMG